MTNLREQIIQLLANCMAEICGAKGQGYKWRDEANRIMQYWLDTHGSFSLKGAEDYVNILAVWQDFWVMYDNDFPMAHACLPKKA